MENYADAADSRLDDWDTLNKGHRKVGTIHLGGIYIECLLKEIICCKHSVGAGCRQHKWMVDNREVSQPSHSLTAPAYRNLLRDLYDDMPADIMCALEYISAPNNISYIDYRYISEDSISETDYDKWNEEFIRIFGYLHDKKHEA